MTHLTRIEWSFVRGLIGRPRRLSAAFLQSERTKLANYRHEVRTLRQVQLTGGTSAGLELVKDADLSGLHGTMQMAVGQRVTAFHPKERHLFTGTAAAATHQPPPPLPHSHTILLSSLLLFTHRHRPNP